MYLLLLMYGLWLNHRYRAAICCVSGLLGPLCSLTRCQGVVFSVLGWPFAALTVVPLILDSVVSVGFVKTVSAGATCSAAVVVF